MFGLLQKTNQLLEQSIETFCLCIHIFDCIISKFPITKEQMFPLGLVSMQIASKIHEKQNKIILYKDLDSFILPIGIEQYCEMEKMVLRTLEFRINLVSPHQILNFLIVEFFKPKYNFFGNFENNEENKLKFRERCQQISLTTLVDYEFYQYTSLAISISILILTRKFFHLDLWNSQMVEFTGIQLKHVKDCLLILNSKIESDYVFRLFKNIDEENKILEDQNSSEINSETSNLLLQNSIDYFMKTNKNVKNNSLADTAEFSAK